MKSLRQLARHAGRAPLFWVSVSLAVITFLLLVVWRGPELNGAPSDLRLRLWGMVLQLLGVATVWLDLTGTGRQFGRTGPLREWASWIAGFFRSQDVRSTHATFVMGKPQVVAHGRAKHGPTTPDLDGRVEALEKNLEALASSIDARQRAIEDRASALAQKTAVEHESLARSLGELQGTVSRVAVGNVDTLLFGVAWLAIGVIIATLAPELARIAAGQWSTVFSAL